MTIDRRQSIVPDACGRLGRDILAIADGTPAAVQETAA
jgi:hypothetical protein